MACLFLPTAWSKWDASLNCEQGPQVIVAGGWPWPGRKALAQGKNKHSTLFIMLQPQPLAEAAHSTSKQLKGGGSLPLKTFDQFKHEQYRAITVIWAFIIVAAYFIALYRTSVEGNCAHWAMVLSLQTLCLIVASASHKGSAKDLRRATFVLWLLRTCWYVLLSLGVMSLSFQGALSSSEKQTSYPSLTSWTTVLFNIIAMVHLPHPLLLLTIQAFTLAASSVKLGKPALPSIVQSLVVHGASGIANVFMERRDRSCYALMVQRQRQALEALDQAHHAKGSSSRDGRGAAGAGTFARSATAGDSRTVCSASAPIEPSLHATTATTTTITASSILPPNSSLPSCAAASPSISCQNATFAPCSQLSQTNASTVDPDTDASSLTGSSPRSDSQSMLLSNASADGKVGKMSRGVHSGDERGVQDTSRRVHTSSSQGGGGLHCAVLAQWDAGESDPATLRRVHETMGRLRNRRPVYKQRYHKHQVVIKVPCAAGPEDLPDSTLPRLVSILQEGNPGCIVSNSATRSGCIIVKLDLQRTKDAASASEGKQEGFQALAAAAQAWLQETELDAQLPSQKPILIQVDDALGELVLDANTHSWSMRPIGTLPKAASGSEEEYSIDVTAHALLMPHTRTSEEPQHPGCQHCKNSSSTSCSNAASNVGVNKARSIRPEKGSNGSTVLVQAHVRVPGGVQIAGWSKNPSSLDSGLEAGAQVAVKGSRSNRQLLQGKSKDVALVRVLANIQGYGYATTGLAEVPLGGEGDCPAEKGKSKGCSYKVCVSVPECVAARTRPRLLSLELWQGDTLLSSSSSILLPACMPGAASELQSLPWGGEGTEDLTDYVTDLGHWLHHNYAGNVMPSSNPAAHAQQQKQELEHQKQQLQKQQQQQQQQQQLGPSPWDVGVSLLRQSVLWGLPSVSTLLVDTLMGERLPSAPTGAPFARLAHAPVRDATSAAAAGQHDDDAFDDSDGGDGLATHEMGGLLHLSLLCPNANAMLAAVLDWGRRWDSSEPNFAWRWDERNAVGLTPLDILSTLPKDSDVLQLLLCDPGLAVIPLTAALQRARDREEAASASASASDAALLQHEHSGGDGGDAHAHQDDRSPFPHDAPHSVSAEGGALLPAVPSLQGASLPTTATTTNSAPTALPLPVEGPSAASMPSLFLRYAATNCVRLKRRVVAGCGAAMRSSHASLGRLPSPQALRGSQHELQQQQQQQQLQHQREHQQQHLQKQQQRQPGNSHRPVRVEAQSLPEAIPYSEAEYRAWANAQAAPMAKAWLQFQICTVLVLFIKDLLLRGASVALVELTGLGPYISVHVVTVLLLHLFPQLSELFIAGLILGRSLILLLPGWGVLPLTQNPYYILSTPLLFLYEVVLSACFEQVRLSWVAPLRVALFLSFKELCSHAKISQSWIYSAQVNMGGMLVAVAIDLRMRRLYTQRMQRQMAQMGLTCSQCKSGKCSEKLGGGDSAGGEGARAGAHACGDNGGGDGDVGGSVGEFAAAAGGAESGVCAKSSTPHQHLS